MFFKKFRIINIALSVVFLSSQIHAAEIPKEQIYLPKSVVTPASHIQPIFPEDQILISENSRYFISPLSYDMDRMEAVKKALDEASIQVASEQEKAVEPQQPQPLKLLREVNPPAAAKTESQESPKKAQTKTSIKQAPSVKVSEAPLGNALSKPDEISTISLDEIINANPTRPSIRLVYDTSMIIQGKNIQRFLAMDEGFISVKTIDPNQIMVKALKFGGTFLNVWDDSGRRTIYVGVIFPQTDDRRNAQQSYSEEHEKPFRFSYSNDWNTYYYGVKGDKFKRQSYQFSQNFDLVGQTPYGLFDSGLVTDEFDGKPQISGYTVGLSRIPTPYFDLLSVRGFDANRYMSELTMPSTRLRGVFADAVTFDKRLGVSFSSGLKRPYFLFLSNALGTAESSDSYVNALKLTLFPTDRDNQISLNAAQGSGPDSETLAKKAYSIEVRKKILNTYLNAEHAIGNNRTSTLAGAHWKKGNFNTRLNFRQINKNFTTISTLPSNQGEIGGVWTTNYDSEHVSESTSVDIYRQTLFNNPNNPDAINTSIYSQLRVPLINKFISDTGFYYNHTPGDISPRRNISLDERISRLFNFLVFKNTNIYVGGGLQKVRYQEATVSFGSSSYDRSSVNMGIQIPLTKSLSFYDNYEFAWVHELETGNDITPNVNNVGLSYRHQWTDQFAGSFNMYHRRELGGQATTYLSGEDSLGFSMGLSYSPVNDATFFFDASTRKIWPRVAENVAYNDLDVRFGCRLGFDIFKRGWDPRGTISGHVYKDKEGGGLYKKDYQGIPGVKVKVGEKEVVTDKDGFYKMSVSAKNVTVTPVADTLPSGMVYSTPDSRKVPISPWGNPHVDFGLNSQTGVYGLVFVDNNSNGTPDPSDKFIKSVKVVLDKKYTSISDTQGAFYFRNIEEGVHTARVDINTLPIDMIPQVKLEQKITVAEGSTYLLHIPLKIKPPSEKE